LIRDNDSKDGAEFVCAASAIKVLGTPILTPESNAVCERFLGSVRRECLDQMLILNDRQLHRKIKEYVMYFNTARSHQGINHCISVPPIVPDGQQATGDKFIALAVLNGLAS
jgi:putative transposase